MSFEKEEESDEGLSNIFIIDECETSEDESIPSCARSLNRRIRRKAAEKMYMSFKTIASTKDLPSTTTMFDDLESLKFAMDYVDVINFYRKESLDEGYIEDETNTTESESSLQLHPLNCTFDTQQTDFNDKSYIVDKQSPKRSVACAIVNQTRRLKRTGGPLTGIARLLVSLKTADSEDELTETETDWQFLQVPEAPRTPIIIPGDQLSAWTPARNCKVSVRAGKVRHMIEYFNQMHDNMNDGNFGLAQHPCQRQGEIRICPGSYTESRKLIQKFLRDVRPSTDCQAKKKTQRPSIWKRVRDAVCFRKE